MISDVIIELQIALSTQICAFASVVLHDYIMDLLCKMTESKSETFDKDFHQWLWRAWRFTPLITFLKLKHSVNIIHHDQIGDTIIIFR